MVYVLNRNGSPLMPCKEAKARRLLKYHKAKVYKREPFTIQLLFECENHIQDITLGIDAGSKHIGLSATTGQKELYAADVELRCDVVELLSTRRQYRQARRNRLRYRAPRFHNRIHSKNKGWLAPSVEQKIKTHLRVPKEHITDARCISGNPQAEPLGYYFSQKKVRCHNRQIHKANIQKGGSRKRNQMEYLVKGFRLFDKVRYDNQAGIIFGRRASGYFDIRKLNGEVIHRSASYKKLELLDTRKTLLTERRQAVSLMA